MFCDLHNICNQLLSISNFFNPHRVILRYVAVLCGRVHTMQPISIQGPESVADPGGHPDRPPPVDVLHFTAEISHYLELRCMV